ncbi:MAG: replication initiator protein [Microvirus sp.]|nr:MAG: replication initiator protein [Microvirus sp.]
MSCLRPITLLNKSTVPCGKCPNCLYRQASGWAFRLLQEERVSSSSYFITFTYAPENIVTTPSGKSSLCSYHFQCFIKRLRKQHRGDHPIKYYAVGEYGSKTKRPHYHAIIFNADVETIELAWSHREPGKKPVQIGELYYGDVTGASIGYTLKYISKGRIVPTHPGDDRQREFSLMSKGLGISYLSENIKAWHQADLYNRSFLTLPGGIKTSMPRYYYEKLYDGYQKDLLKFSGSLIRQDEFFKLFEKGLHMGHESLIKEQLMTKRVDAAFRKHNYQNQKTLVL